MGGVPSICSSLAIAILCFRCSGGVSINPQLSQAEAYYDSLASIEEDLPRELSIDGSSFVHFVVNNPSECKEPALFDAYFGTVEDSLMAISPGWVRNDCNSLFPLLCWSDTVPGQQYDYPMTGISGCKDNSNIQGRLRITILAFARIDNEKFFLVSYEILEYLGIPIAAMIDLENNARPNDRHPIKTLLISSIKGPIGGASNGLKIDLFPF